jgi:hypothetical protein
MEEGKKDIFTCLLCKNNGTDGFVISGPRWLKIFSQDMHPPNCIPERKPTPQ